MKDKFIRFGVIILLFVLFFIMPNDYGYYKDSSFISHLLFSFNHTSIFHVAINCVGFYFFSKWLFNIHSGKYWLTLGIPVLVSIASSYMVNFYSIPTVGFSGVVYAMIGVYLASVLFDDSLEVVDKKIFLTWLLVLCLFIVVGLLPFTSSNGILHLVTMFLGCFIASTLFAIDFFKNNK